MNTARIATLYPYFLDALRQLHTGRSLDDMMATVQLALLLKASARAGSPNRWVTLRDQDNPIQRFDELGLPSEDELKELVPARLFDWVYQQQPVQPTCSDDLVGMLAEYHAGLGAATGWRVTANEVMPALQGVPGQPAPTTKRIRGQYATWTGTEQELATLLRGLRAFRAKRRKQTRRLIAQLWAYHLTQQQAPQVEALSSLVIGAEGICYKPEPNALTTESVGLEAAADLSAPRQGLLPRLVGKLRRGLAAKIHQVAVATEAVLAAEGGIAA
jgi:hypothetical protein